jgi:hypothetical protein
MGELYVGRSAFPILFQAVAAVEIPLEIPTEEKGTIRRSVEMVRNNP